MTRLSRTDVRRRVRDHIARGGMLAPVLLAVCVGIAGGLGALALRGLIYGATLLSTGGSSLDSLGVIVVVLPAAGLVLAVLLVRGFAQEAEGTGVPEVMYAVRRGRGRIRPRVALVKALASAITIGSGGSIGREGPIVHIGSALGSALGQALGLRDDQLKLLLTCGAAAGVAGTFNAPIAGALFALEVVLGKFSGRSFGLVVVASVTGTAVVQMVVGSSLSFPLHGAFALETAWELPLYVALGLLAGAVSVVYLRSVHRIQDLFRRWSAHVIIKAALGGVLVGTTGWIGIRYLGGPWLLGVGYGGIEHVLTLQAGATGMTVLVLLGLAFLKIVATSTTLGAGGSGGVFAPALFIGAMVGAAFGVTVGTLFPETTAPPGAYALVAMAAVFAGAARAPMTAILILFEMTDSHLVMLPLMLAVVLSYLISGALSKDSIYSAKLRRLGGYGQPAGAYGSVLETILVTDTMDTNPPRAAPEQAIRELVPVLTGEGIHAIPVAEDNRLVGLLTTMQINRALLSPEAGTLTVRDIMIREPLTCEPRESLFSLLRRIGERDIEAVPVVDDEHNLIGFISHNHILWAHDEMLQEHDTLIHRAEDGFQDRQTSQILFEVLETHRRLAYTFVRDLRMPKRSRIALLHRGTHSVVPRGSTRIDPGDVLVIVAPLSDEVAVRAWLASIHDS